MALPTNTLLISRQRRFGEALQRPGPIPIPESLYQLSVASFTNEGYSAPPREARGNRRFPPDRREIGLKELLERRHQEKPGEQILPIKTPIFEQPVYEDQHRWNETGFFQEISPHYEDQQPSTGPRRRDVRVGAENATSQTEKRPFLSAARIENLRRLSNALCRYPEDFFSSDPASDEPRLDLSKHKRRITATGPFMLVSDILGYPVGGPL